MAIHDAEYDDQDDQSDMSEDECEPAPIEPNS